MTTFSITVECEHDITPLSVQEMMDYILLKLEYDAVLKVVNIVRDY